MDLGSIATQLGALFGMQPSTFLMWVFIITTASRAMANRIPANATGFWGFMRQTFSILGIKVEDRLTSDATVTDVAKAALVTPPIDDNVEAGAQPTKD